MHKYGARHILYSLLIHDPTHESWNPRGGFGILERMQIVCGSSGWALAIVLVVADVLCAAGACCTADSCVAADNAGDCASIGGVFLDGADCATGACGIGACCSEVACLDGLDVFACVASGREPAGTGTVCADDPCGNDSGACCLPRGCVIESGVDCTRQGGVWRGADTVCGSTSCAAGACCDLVAGVCADDTPITDCATALQHFASGAACAELQPPCVSEVGVCCTAGGCLQTIESLCVAGDGTWQGAADCAVCPPAGACCVNGEDCVELTATACADQGFTWIGADSSCSECPAAPTCDRAALFALDPAVPPSFFGGTSELGSGFKRSDDYSGVTRPIDRVQWWGIDLAPLPGGGWKDCEDSGSFILSFHADDGGAPAVDAVCTYPVIPQRAVHPLSYSGTPLNIYTVDLVEPCDLPAGWLSITGAGDADCWFLWMSAAEPGESYCMGCPGDIDFENFSFCLESNQVGACKTSAVCSDADADGLRDDVCTWWDCVDGLCQDTAVPYGDVGSPDGCAPDGVVDEADRQHILDCFAAIRSGTGNPYPCEDNAPNATNLDVAGAFGACVPDGVCDGHDAFAVDNVIRGGAGCDCDGDPAPAVVPEDLGPVKLDIEVKTRRRRSGPVTVARVILRSPLRAVRGVQVQVALTGRRAQGVAVAEIVIHEDDAGDEPAWAARNLDRAQFVAGWDEPIDLPVGHCLGTFVFETESIRPLSLDIVTDGTHVFR